MSSNDMQDVGAVVTYNERPAPADALPEGVYDPFAALAAAAARKPASKPPAQADFLPCVRGAKWDVLPGRPVATPELTKGQLAEAVRNNWVLFRITAAQMVQRKQDVAPSLRRATVADAAAAEAKWGRRDYHVCGPHCQDSECPLRDLPGWACARFAMFGVCVGGCPFPHVEATMCGELWLTPRHVELNAFVAAAVFAMEPNPKSLVEGAEERARVDREARRAKRARAGDKGRE